MTSDPLENVQAYLLINHVLKNLMLKILKKIFLIHGLV